ncbi:TKTL2 protein, partial [Polyodon spathula]|nr:TKTL2 protein [Polyodon spathula]
MASYHKPDEKTLQGLRDMANKLRIHSIKATCASSSGHPTSCCSAAEIMSVLFFNTMKYKTTDPRNANNDRFIMSKGHAAPILYAAWAEIGYVKEADLLNLRKIDCELEGHPTPKLAFVDVATGSLGQGLGAACGMAYTGKHFDKASYRVFCLMGDGESSEGAVWEAMAFASHYQLDNLVAIFDVNRLGQSEAAPLKHDTEVYRKRCEAFGTSIAIALATLADKAYASAALSMTSVILHGLEGQVGSLSPLVKVDPCTSTVTMCQMVGNMPKPTSWAPAVCSRASAVLETEGAESGLLQDNWNTYVVDGHDVEELSKALWQAQQVKDKPTAIVAKTFKGKGIQGVEDQDNWHGKPIPKDKVDAILADLQGRIQTNKLLYPEQPVEDAPVVDISSMCMPSPPDYKIGDKMATRRAYGLALAKLGEASDRVVALDGDTKNSTFSDLFKKAHPERFIECFIAEQNMASHPPSVSVAMGCATRDRNVAFASTFAAFLSRAYDHIRMGAISQSNVNLCGSHCGVSIGEDGPSQMALEDLAMFRAIPTCTVFYPSDAVSTEKAVELSANTKVPRCAVTLEHGRVRVFIEVIKTFKELTSNLYCKCSTETRGHS